jgi:UDP-N-acetylmuramoyl-tripeptide--D-alanyl-D-alanine ligase
MLELGPQAASLHADLANALHDGKVDQLYAAGPMMKHLFDAVPDACRGVWHEKAAELQAPLFDTLQPGDVVMVKGSNGSRMGPLVAAMKEHFVAPSDSSAAQAMVQE